MFAALGAALAGLIPSSEILPAFLAVDIPDDQYCNYGNYKECNNCPK